MYSRLTGNRVFYRCTGMSYLIILRGCNRLDRRAGVSVRGCWCRRGSLRCKGILSSRKRYWQSYWICVTGGVCLVMMIIRRRWREWGTGMKACWLERGSSSFCWMGKYRIQSSSDGHQFIILRSLRVPIRWSTAFRRCFHPSLYECR